jgi:hypothetical protein
MSPSDVAHAVRVRLAAELARELQSLEELVASVASMGTQPSTPMHALALAFQLERYYTGAEALLSRALRTIDGDVPSGGSSHQEILLAASVAVEGLRPAIVSNEVFNQLRDLLAFRHYARHAYDKEPRSERVGEIAETLLQMHPALLACVREFATWLSRPGDGA